MKAIIKYTLTGFSSQTPTLYPMQEKAGPGIPETSLNNLMYRTL